jgi:serine/threonine protein kinase
MNSTRKDLVGPRPDISAVLGDMIGFGTFASVYKHKTDDNQVAKLSRYGADAALARETATLRALLAKLPAGSNIGIARFIGNDKVDINIGGVDVKLPALVMEPRGVSLEMWLAKYIELETKKKALIDFGDQLSTALAFIHENGYYHNDISPKNIMFDTRGNTAFLIDFGLASEAGKNIKGFRGTASYYAHRVIFQMYPYVSWKPAPEYDRTSLAFSMAALSNGGKRLWNSYQPANLDNARKVASKLWAGKRTAAAKGKLQDVGFSNEWSNWCEDGR